MDPDVKPAPAVARIQQTAKTRPRTSSLPQVVTPRKTIPVPAVLPSIEISPIKAQRVGSLRLTQGAILDALARPNNHRKFGRSKSLPTILPSSAKSHNWNNSFASFNQLEDDLLNEIKIDAEAMRAVRDITTERLAVTNGSASKKPPKKLPPIPVKKKPPSESLEPGEKDKGRKRSPTNSEGGADEHPTRHKGPRRGNTKRGRDSIASSSDGPTPSLSGESGKIKKGADKSPGPKTFHKNDKTPEAPTTAPEIDPDEALLALLVAMPPPKSRLRMGPAGVMIEELNNDEDPEVSKQREKIDQLLQKKLAENVEIEKRGRSASRVKNQTSAAASERSDSGDPPETPHRKDKTPEAPTKPQPPPKELKDKTDHDKEEPKDPRERDPDAYIDRTPRGSVSDSTPPTLDASRSGRREAFSSAPKQKSTTKLAHSSPNSASSVAALKPKKNKSSRISTCP